MATARKFKNKDGTTSYKISVNFNGSRQSKSFSTKQLATDWSNKRIQELEREEIFGKKTTAIVKRGIEDYQQDFGTDCGKTKKYDIERLKKYPLAELSVNKLTPKHLIDHCLHSTHKCNRK